MYKKTVLNNNLRVIAIPMTTSETATVFVLIGTGSRNEKKETNGISHFLEHLFFKGSKKRPSFLKISQALDSVGGAYNAFTSKEYTGFFAKTKSTDIDLALDWISDLVLSPRLREEDVEKERGVITEEINMVQDAPMGYVADLWEKLLYKEDPLGWFTIGTKENIKSIKKQDISDYFKQGYTAQNMVIAIAGKIEKGVEKKVENYFAGLKKAPAKEKIKVLEKKEGPEVLAYYKKTDQTHFCLGFRAFDYFHPKKYSQTLLATMLGGNASSRIFNSVRVEAGLAYYVHTSAETYADCGYLVTQAGVAHNNVKKAIELILKEYKKIKENKIGQTELKRAKDFLKGTMSLGLETSDSLASFFASQELLRKKILSPKEIFEEIDEVKIKDISETAEEIFQPKLLNLALIGPFAKKQEFEGILKI